MNVAEFVWSRLQEWGMKRIFGYPGDGVGGLDIALQHCIDKGEIEYVQVRHEEMAAFMAAAHAKFTGEVGFCYATSGPGATHLLTGLYDAKFDNAPVVAIIGQTNMTAIGSQYQQELDTSSVFKDVSEFVVEGRAPSQVRTCIDRAVRIAQFRRGVCVVSLPKDLQEMTYEEPKMKHGYTTTGVGFPAEAKVPEEAGLRQAAEVLNAGKKVAMLVGAGALDCEDEITAVADRLGAGCAKALLGKCALPDDLPWVTGQLGLLGTKPSWDLMQECDTLLMVGSNFPYSEFLPKPGDARGVQIDLKGEHLSLRYPMEVNLVGHTSETLKALLPLLKQNDDTSWRKTIAGNLEEWWKVVESRAMASADPINPQRIFTELSKQLPDNVILTADSGSVADWYARDIKVRRGMKGSLSGGLASLGAATPYAMAAKMAYPDRPVIGFIGDGAFQMNGMNVMITVSKYWKKWPDPRFVIMVLNNRDLNQVTWEERIEAGAGKTESTQSIPDVPYHKYAELLGLKGIFVNDPEKLADGWREALSCGKPCVLEVYADPNVPPLAPHITLAQAKNFMSSMVTEPELGSVVKNTVKEVVASVLHR